MTALPSPRFLSSGDTALVVELGDTIDRRVNARVLALAERLDAAAVPGIAELVPTFRSLMVHHDPLVLDAATLEATITALLENLAAEEQPGRVWRLPACYDAALAPDLAEVAERTGLTPAQVAECHSAATYRVYMLGYLPGFPYMGDVPAELNLPRRTEPRTKVPAGAIAIATAMTAVYAIESPGGWNLIGRTPVAMWDLRRDPPALLAPGDEVRFEPVGRDTYEALAAQARDGTLTIAPGPAGGAAR